MKLRLFTVPNMITLLNLLCGSAAATIALTTGDLRTAFWLIALAAVFDFLDGFAARLLGQYSPVGKELDSLADVISFGFAPSAILFMMFQTAGSYSIWGFGVFILAAFSALRLAKFNLDERQTDEFIGLPTPASALLVASCGYVYQQGLIEIQPYAVLITAVVLSILLVSGLRMFSLKFHNFRFKDNALRYIFLILGLASVAIFGVQAIPIVIATYIIVSAVRHIIIAVSGDQPSNDEE